MTDRIVVEIETKARFARAVWLQQFNADESFGAVGVGVSKKSWDRTFPAGAALTELQRRWNDDTPLVFWRRTSGTFWAEDAASANPTSTTFPTLAPLRWMRELNPFDARSETDVVHLSSFIQLPLKGQPDIAYVVDDGSQDRPTSLIWDGNRYKVTGSSGLLPQRTQYGIAAQTLTLRDSGAAIPTNAGIPAHVARVDPSVTVRTAGNVDQMVISTTGAAYNGWNLQVRTINTGASSVEGDDANETITINIVIGNTWTQVLTDLMADADTATYGLSYELVSPVTGTDTVGTLTTVDATLAGGVDAVVPAVATMSAVPAAPEIPTSAINVVGHAGATLDTIRLVPYSRTHLDYAVHVSIDLAADGATWHDGAAVQTAKPTNYAFRWKLWLRRDGIDDIKVYDRLIQGTIGAAETTKTTTVFSSLASAIFEAGDELYSTFEAVGNSSDGQRQASRLSVTAGHIGLRRYVSTISAAIRDSIASVIQPHLVLWQWATSKPADPAAATVWGDSGWPASVTPWATTPPADPADGSVLWGAFTSASKATGSWVQSAWVVLPVTDGTLPAIEFRKARTTAPYGWITATSADADQIRFRHNGVWTPWFPTERYHFAAWQAIGGAIITARTQTFNLDATCNLQDYVELRIGYRVINQWEGAVVWPADRIGTVLESDTVGGINYLHPRRRHGTGLAVERREGTVDTGLPSIAQGFSGFFGLVRPTGGTDENGFNRVRLVTDPNPGDETATYTMHWDLWGR